jgi:hypothetical protein
MQDLEEIEEILIIEDRQTKVQQLINDLMTGVKTLSYSSLKAFKETPADFIEYCFKERKQTDAMFFGTVLHCLVLEPEKFNERYLVLDDTEICNQVGGAKPRATKLYKEWKQYQIDSNPGKEVVTNAVFISASAIANNVLYNRASSKVLSICKGREKPIEWTFKNFKFRGFIDMDGQSAKADLKLMVSASPRKAQRTIIDMSYYLQAAMYLRAEGKILPYYIIAVDRKGGVSVHKLHKHLIEHGLDEYDKLIDKFNECLLMETFNQSYDFYAEAYDGIFVADKPSYLY